MHTNALDRIFEEIFGAFTANDLHVRNERMQKHLSGMTDAHVLYRQVCILSSDEIYENIESEFTDVMSKIENRLTELSRTESSEVLRPVRVIAVNPWIEPQIGKFNGNRSAWPSFRDLFIAEVHNKDFDPVTKLLQEACIEKAANTVGPWQLTRDNYRAAWDHMMAAYNDKYHEIHDIFRKMFAVQRQEVESYGSLRAVWEALAHGTRQLEAKSSQSILWDQVWVHFGIKRLPMHTLDSWEQYRCRNGAYRFGGVRAVLGHKGKRASTILT